MPILLRLRDDLSVNDIKRLARTRAVKVTPHVGNWTPARMVLPTLGVSILCVDHTIGERDVNAHPHLLIQGGEARTLSSLSDRLTTHAHVTQHVPGTLHHVGKSLSAVHVGAIRELYPSADIVTHVEHMRSNKELTLAVLEEATALSRSGVWWRKVDSEGRVTAYRSKDLPRTWKELEPDIFPLTNEQEGWLVHNRVSILMDLIQQSQLGTEPEIYHLSGPDMVRYLGSEIETVSRMYDHVRVRLGFPQESITYNLVPFASFRFATRTAQAGACERLCEELLRNDPDYGALQDSARAASDIFAESETKSYFTQHDCLANADHIVVPEVACEWSMAACASRMDRLRAFA